MVYTIGKATCGACGKGDKCVTIATGEDEPGVTLCGEDIARLLGELTGWSMLNMYRTMRVQSDLRIQNPQGIEEVPLSRRKRK